MKANTLHCLYTIKRDKCFYILVISMYIKRNVQMSCDSRTHEGGNVIRIRGNTGTLISNLIERLSVVRMPGMASLHSNCTSLETELGHTFLWPVGGTYQLTSGLQEWNGKSHTIQ